MILDFQYSNIDTMKNPDFQVFCSVRNSVVSICCDGVVLPNSTHVETVVLIERIKP